MSMPGARRAARRRWPVPAPRRPLSIARRPLPVAATASVQMADVIGDETPVRGQAFIRRQAAAFSPHGNTVEA